MADLFLGTLHANEVPVATLLDDELDFQELYVKLLQEADNSAVGLNSAFRPEAVAVDKTLREAFKEYLPRAFSMRTLAEIEISVGAFVSTLSSHLSLVSVTATILYGKRVHRARLLKDTRESDVHLQVNFSVHVYNVEVSLPIKIHWIFGNV